ncbi:4-coumarate--CoA ligase-like 5 [Acorus calamus]|uniref:4-coumarate--CoA ligase-like 5 n=1 Tax=Acorus calamus TaxID=4465 RepID=A0AAV9EZX8_ACOCL|nr:4-coumarate--CoA ligase-like 5 [Acorus calamus]
MNEGFFRLRQSPSPEVVLLLAPMFHTFGFIFCLKQIALGETTVLMERFSPRAVASAVEEHRVTSDDDRGGARAGGGGDRRRPGHAAEDDHRRSSAREGLSRAVQQAVPTRADRAEAGGISRMIGDIECENFESVGRLSENIEAKIVDLVRRCTRRWPTGGALGARTGHHDSSDGWLKTGDLCRFDQHGFLYVVDRIKELIKYKAYQVPPVELEHLLQSIPDIIDAAVIPCPSEEVGQIPMACVVRCLEAASNEARVAPYKKIRRVVFVESIPKSAAGKILRRELLIHALPGWKNQKVHVCPRP